MQKQVLDIEHESHPGIVRMEFVACMHLCLPNIYGHIELQVYCWGCNDCGQLGLGDTVKRLKLCKVEALSGVVIKQTSEPSPTSAQGQDEKERLELVTEGRSPVKKKIMATVTQAEETQDVFRNFLITDVLQRKIPSPARKKRLENVAEADIPTVLMVDFLESPRPPYPAFVGSTPQKVICGSYYTLALSDHGAVYSWGRNDEGQLGTGDRTNLSIPHKINSEERFIEIAADHQHSTSAALTQTGKVFMWGYCDGKVTTSPLLTEVFTTDDVFVLFSLQKDTWRMYSGAHQKKVQKTDLAQNLSMVPYSLTVSDMLKLGRLTSKKPTIATIHNFSMNMLAWSELASDVEFVEEREPVGSGGFRYAYKASSSHLLFKDKEWVIKRYKPSAIKGLLENGLSVPEHTKKVVQMHMLARNFALKLQEKVLQENLSAQFGNTLSYNKIYYGKTDEGQDVTIEEYVAGSFSKYINNDGLLLCMDPGNEISLKAECLCHYSYQKSDKQLLLVDIQGSNFKCYDPEIASIKLYQGSEILYCAGNLSTFAIENFIRIHKCNVYCRLLGLTELQE